MDTRRYGAYGYRAAATVTIAHTGFCGITGEADLPWYLLGKRFYVPWLRRFLSPDPLSPFGAGELNRYAYCAGDPVNRIDPSGNASFGWLGKLLGQMWGTAATATRTAAQITPSAVLSTVSRTSDVLSVSVSIGAVVAAGVGEERAAGVLGWIAAGSAAAIGLGAAAQSISKGTYTTTGSPGRNTSGASQMSNSRQNTASRKKLTAVASKTFYGPNHAKATVTVGQKQVGGQTHINRQVVTFPQAEWHMQIHPRSPLSPLSVHIMSDSIITSGDLPNAIAAAPSIHGNQTFYGNGHGQRNGLNRDPATGGWSYPAPHMFTDINAANNDYLSTHQITTFDVSTQTREAYRQSMRSPGIHFHYYCYSGASEDVVQELGLLGQTRFSRPPEMAPAPSAVSDSWWEPPIDRI